MSFVAFGRFARAPVDRRARTYGRGDGRNVPDTGQARREGRVKGGRATRAGKKNTWNVVMLSRKAGRGPYPKRGSHERRTKKKKTATLRIARSEGKREEKNKDSAFVAKTQRRSIYNQPYQTGAASTKLELAATPERAAFPLLGAKMTSARSRNPIQWRLQNSCDGSPELGPRTGKTTTPPKNHVGRSASCPHLCLEVSSGFLGGHDVVDDLGVELKHSHGELLRLSLFPANNHQFPAPTETRPIGATRELV